MKITSFFKKGWQARLRRSVRKLIATESSWVKKRLVLPEGAEPTQYVSFVHSKMEGTLTQYGVIIGFFNGYTKRALANRHRCIDLEHLHIVDRTKPPVSTEPHARVLIEDDVRGEEFFSEVWVPVNQLTFHTEEEVGTNQDVRAESRRLLRMSKYAPQSLQTTMPPVSPGLVRR